MHTGFENKTEFGSQCDPKIWRTTQRPWAQRSSCLHLPSVAFLLPTVLQRSPQVCFSEMTGIKYHPCQTNRMLLTPNKHVYPSQALGKYSKMIFFLPWSRYRVYKEGKQSYADPLLSLANRLQVCCVIHSHTGSDPCPASRMLGWDLPSTIEWDGKIPSWVLRSLAAAESSVASPGSAESFRLQLSPIKNKGLFECICFSALKVYKI